jgi:hypothetical protein
VKHFLYIILSRCLFLSINSIFAVDFEMVSFDQLPDNAEEVARAHVKEFLAQRYPEETIVIGEAIPLYVLENEVKVLDFILELNGETSCTFERELEIHIKYKEKHDAFLAYFESLHGDPKALLATSKGEDSEYNMLLKELREADYPFDSLNHVLVGFIDGAPRLVGTHLPSVMFSNYLSLSNYQKSNFVGFGLIPSIYPSVKIACVLYDEEGYIWFTTWNYEYSFADVYPILSTNPLSWYFFISGFKDRGREDVSPLGFELGGENDIYGLYSLDEINMSGSMDCYSAVLCMRYIHLFAKMTAMVAW